MEVQVKALIKCEDINVKAIPPARSIELRCDSVTMIIPMEKAYEVLKKLGEAMNILLAAIINQGEKK